MVRAKLTRKWLCVAFLAAIVLLFALTSPALAYLYRASFTVANNGSTDYTALPVSCTAPVIWLIDNGFITTATALDTRVETFGGSDQLHMMAEDRIMAFCPTLDHNSQLNWYLSTGNTALPDFPVIVGDSGYVTVADNASLELGNNFSIEFDGYLAPENGGASQIYKQNSFRLYLDDDDDLHASLLSPNYFYYKESLYEDDWVVGFSAGVGVQSKEADHLYLTATGLADERTYVTDSAVNLTGIDTLYIDWECTKARAVFAADTDKMNDYTDRDYFVQHIAPFGRTVDSVDVSAANGNYYLRVHVHDGTNNGPELKVYNVYAEIGDIDLEKADMTGGEYLVKFYNDGVTLKLDIDGTTADSTSSSPHIVASDNVTDWVINITYFDYYKHTVDETLIAWYQPIALISGTTLPNRLLPGSHDGTITWGTNPSGVSVTLGSLTAEAISVVTDDEDAYVDPLRDAEVSDWFLEPDIGVKLASHPLRPLVCIMSDGTTATEVQAWRFLGLAILLLVTVSAAALVRGHLLIAGLACGGTIALLAQQTIWPGWTLVFIIPAIVAGLLAERTPSIG